MVNTSKILTVSYGTFSCTLEGFDESFDTMKAIAEYFRDLAADDRYFGAEPPTPDADMLARIAEREIARRVEAHENEGKIVLRAGDAPALAGLAAAHAPQQQPAKDAPAPKVQEAAEKPEIDAPAKQHAQAEMHDAAQDVTDTAETDRVSPEVAALGEDEDVQNAVEAQDDVQAEFASQADAIGDTSDDVAEDSQPIEAQPAPEAAVEAEPEAATSAEPEEAYAEEEPEPEIQVQVAEDTQTEQEDTHPEAEHAAGAVEEQPEDESDSVAAKLRRIRSVVSHSDQAYGDSDYTEDEHAQDFVDATAADLDDALAQDDAAEITQAAEDEAADDDSDQAQDDSDGLDALLARFDDDTQDDAAAATFEPAESDHQQEVGDLAEDTLAQLLADAMPEQDEPHDLPQEAGGSSTPLRLGPESVVDQAETVEDGEAAQGIDNEEYSSEDVDEQPVLRARVVKMKRTEFEAALAKGYIEEDDADDAMNVFGEDSDDDSAEFDQEDLGLSPEEEAELQRELAEVAAELDTDATPQVDAARHDIAEASDTHPDNADAVAGMQAAEDDALVAEQDKSALRGRDKLDHGQKPQTDVNRIFDKADTHLDEPESHQRRSVIRHLRAAVAATRAEKKAGADLDKSVDDTPYRSDLQEVVRPRRPQANGAARSARPEEQRPAPLKLVAEQRVDTETPRDPVRPRRISSSALAPAQTADFETDSGFADFAEQMGATRLPVLLEAAAAYLSDVEGRPQFSRPMLMSKLKEVSQDSFSREDGLRSFGQLLREGKLQKLKGGRFAVTDETDFRDEARSVG